MFYSSLNPQLFLRLKISKSQSRLEDFFGNSIAISLIGMVENSFLAVVRNGFDEIHRELSEFIVNEQLVCKCSECKDDINPTLFDVKDLYRRKEKGKTTVECIKSYNDVLIQDIFSNISEAGTQEGFRNINTATINEWLNNISKGDCIEVIKSLVDFVRLGVIVEPDFAQEI